MKISHSPIQNATFQKRYAPLIITVTLLFSLLIIALTPPATGYELSVYDAFPTILWVLIAINIFFSIFTIIQSCDSRSKNSYYGYFSILLIELIILLLPIIRGYYSINRVDGDMFHHIFVASQILNSGYLPLDDIYPIMHIWLSILNHFLPNLIILTILLSMIFLILYVLSLYILGKNLLGTKNGGIFVSIFGIPLIFSFLHSGFIPFFFALLTFPLILYMYQKIIQDPTQKKAFYICLIFFSFFIVFCHPMVSVFLIVVFSIFALFESIRIESNSRPSNIDAAKIVIILFLTLTVWWLQFRDLLGTLQRIIFTIFGGMAYTSIVQNQVNAVNTSNVSIWLVLDHFFKIYGPICLYFLIALLFLLCILYNYFKNKELPEDDFIYSLQFLAALFIGIALITGFFAIDEPIRALMDAIIFATILCGLFFYRIWFSVPKKSRLGLSISITSLMTLVCMLAIMTVYFSPWISLPNPALSNEDKNGFGWIFTYRNTELPIVSETGQMWKFSNYYYESTNRRNDQNLLEYPWRIPSNFGYMTNRTIRDSFAYLPEKNLYLITTESMKLAPYAVSADRRNRLKSFTDSDFIRLKNDPSVNLVYSSNQFGVLNLERP